MRKRLLSSELLANFFKSYPVSYIDVGARGDIAEPWLGMKDEHLRVYGFEPDPTEAARLNELYKGKRIYYRAGLWNKEGTIKIHLADIPSTSSIHPPNFNEIKVFEEKHWRPRNTKSIVQVKCTTLDAIHTNEAIEIDFIKVDTQGSEYEILEGAKQCLKNEVIGLLLETWTTEVHRGQRLMGEILTLVNHAGFILFDYNPGALWYRNKVTQLPAKGKPQIIGFDLLFFRKSMDFETPAKTFAKGIKAIAIAEAFGYPDYALEILEVLQQKNIEFNGLDLNAIKDEIIENWKPVKQHGTTDLIAKSFRRLFSLLGLRNDKLASENVKTNYLH